MRTGFAVVSALAFSFFGAAGFSSSLSGATGDAVSDASARAYTLRVTWCSSLVISRSCALGPKLVLSVK